MNVLVTLNSGQGIGLGPNFLVYSDIGTLSYNTTLTELLAGVELTFEDAATIILIESLGVCLNILPLPIVPTTTTTTTLLVCNLSPTIDVIEWYTTTTTSTTVEPTTTTSTTTSCYTPIVMTYEMPSDNLNLILPVVNQVGLNYDFIVDWGDLSSSHITSATDPDILHNYSGAGTYTVTISGIMEGFCMAGVDAPCLTAISGGSCHIFKFLGGDVYGYGAFDECINLVTANIPDWNISQVTDLTYLFWECHSLEVCHLENWDTSSVTLMVDMWDDATFNLTSIDLSNWNTSNVTSFSDMFTSGGGASALTEIIGTENWDVSSATNMSGMFEGLDGLLTINLTGWDTTNVTDMNHMFSDCTSLTTAMDSSIFWDNLGGGTSVLNYTLCFYNATNISNYASIPAGWK